MNDQAALTLHKAFPDLPAEDVHELAAVAQVRAYPSGVILCHEGRIEDVFYIVSSGRAEISKQIDEDTYRVLAYAGPGEFFGEIALVQKSPRIATVRTAEPTTVLEIDHGTFEAVLYRSPRMAIQIIRQVTSRLRDTEQKTVADLRKKNIELARAYAELEEEQRLRSEFLTTVAHELRTPLTAVNGYLSLIRSGVVRAEQQQEVLSTVARNVDTVVHLVNSILFLQELELITPEFQPLAFDELVLQAVNGVRERAAASGVWLQVQVEPGVPAIEGDPAGLQRAISALLDNAIKFSPDGGEVRVEVLTQDGRVGVRICDPGVGIPAEEIGRIFEPFTRVQAPDGRLFGGIGLGLPIARHVVEQHGGRIDVESRVGQGSTFTILI